MSKEVKLAAKMRAIADEDKLPPNHPLWTQAAALDICAELAFVPGGAKPGAHKAYQKAMLESRAILRRYKSRLK